MTIWTIYNQAFRQVADYTLPKWRGFAHTHGYNLVENELENDGDLKDFHYSFFKIRELCRYLQRNHLEIVWCIDLDMMPTNWTIFPHQWLTTNDIYITKDINGLNSGSFFVASGDRTDAWLRSIVALRHQATSEQHAMWMLQEAYDPYTKYLPHPSINSIDYAMYPAFRCSYDESQGQWKPGHLLVHLPGMNTKQRLDILPTYEKHVIR